MSDSPRTPIALGLARRTVLAMVVAVVLPLCAVLALVATLGSGSVGKAQAALVADLAPESNALGCLAAQGPWRQPLGKLAVAYGYDGQTLRSDHPEAPALSEAVREALERGERSAAEVSPAQLGGGVIAARVAGAGRCGVIAIAWAPPDKGARALALLLALALAGGGAAGLGLFWVVRPLLVRLRRLTRLAAQVGSTLDGEAVEARGDEVSDIERALRGAHAQLVEDRALLLEKRSALERFLRELGHDLKTPIASLSLSLGEVLETPGVPLEAGRAAVAEVLYLEHLVENLRVEANLREGVAPEPPHPFDLREVTERTAARLLPLARNAGVALDWACPDVPLEVLADRTLVERALSNLLHNAVVHGARHVAVTLERTGPGFTLLLLDDGPGLEHRPAVRRGEGLGLKIARSVLEAQGFTLVLAAAPGGGVAATVTGRCAPA